jgi:hypothetical protein
MQNIAAVEALHSNVNGTQHPEQGTISTEQDHTTVLEYTALGNTNTTVMAL